MADQQANRQNQSEKTQAQNGLNHALHTLNEAAHSNVNREQDVQEAKEELYKARLEHMQAQNSQAADTTRNTNTTT